jgi:FKBP-type peptidyl-prolyl cis-trans isomerase FkpA
MRRWHLPGLLFAGWLAAGCASAPAPPLEQGVFAPVLGVDLAGMEHRPGGLYVRDLREGDGPQLRRGHRVSVHFVGWLPDGRQFDAHVRPSEPLEFRLGRGEVIRGWEEGLLGMRVGGQRQLVVPPRLGYGPQGVAGIPGNSALLFIIDVVEAR